ncbi:MAG: hypothetical protein ACQER4_02685 [Bacteroidota bacterium]
MQVITRLFKGVAPAVLFLLFITACEDPGGVGSDFLDSEGKLETRTLEVESLNEVQASAFSGNLPFMALGEVDDPLFGRYRSVGLIKPAIDTTSIGSDVTGEIPFQLRLVFSGSVYGDTLSSATFEVYRAADVWRGNEIKFEDDHPVDSAEMVGEFTVDGNETVEVDLSQTWREEFEAYLSNSEVDRDSTYREEFPGLAIVPAAGTEKMLFAVMESGSSSADDLDQTRFVRTPPEDSDDSEEEEEEEEEDPRQFLPPLDWGYVGERDPAGQADPQSLHLLSSLHSFGELETGLSSDVVDSRNLVHVQLVVNVNRQSLEANVPDHFSRPAVNQLQLHRVNSDRIGDWIFSREPDYVALYDEETDSYRFNITGHVRDLLFDEPNPGTFYMTAQSMNGVLFTIPLYNDQASDAGRRPRIVITSVNSDES